MSAGVGAALLVGVIWMRGSGPDVTDASLVEPARPPQPVAALEPPPEVPAEKAKTELPRRSAAKSERPPRKANAAPPAEEKPVTAAQSASDTPTATPAPDPAPPQQELKPATVNLTGRWYTADQFVIGIEQQGSHVGLFALSANQGAMITGEGSVKGRKLSLKLGGLFGGEAKGTLTLSEDGKRLAGKLTASDTGEAEDIVLYSEQAANEAALGAMRKYQ
jgi:hypothetical protein